MDRLVAADIETYAQAYSMAESDLCRALQEETQRRMESPQMIVGPLEGAFLKMMTQLVRATSVLEIGMFTGYSALCFAEALPVEGTVLTCEVDEQSAALARQYFARSPTGARYDAAPQGTVRPDLHRRRQSQLCELLPASARSCVAARGDSDR